MQKKQEQEKQARGKGSHPVFPALVDTNPVLHLQYPLNLFQAQHSNIFPESWYAPVL